MSLIRNWPSPFRAGHPPQPVSQIGNATRIDTVTQKDQRKLATSERALQALDEWLGAAIASRP